MAELTDDPVTSTLHGFDASPNPSDEEVVAIMAAMESLWPRPVVVVDAPTGRNTAWRFSGRWWSRPVPARRDRPFR